ncbi:MAG: DUF2163 domain-containing protein [Hyphomicrobiales bacterium]|nr:DUF2163 domain-containing protein [Hyphomicrobiales bacterium]
MRVLPAGMQDHLDSGATTLCNCWRLLRNDGTVLGFTDHDRSLQFDGTTFEAATGFSAARMESHLGFAIGGTEVAGALASEALDEAGLSNGLYDNARVEIWLVNWNDVAQRLLIDTAIVGEVRRNASSFTAELRSAAHAFDQERGRVYQSGCSADLGDHRCRVDTAGAAYRTVASVTRILSQSRFEVDATSFPDGWFSGGRAGFLTGGNAGAWGVVESHQRLSGSCIVRLWTAPAAAIVVNDQVELVAGCDKAFETCRAKFANADNFRGFPHIPGNSALLTHPGTSDGVMDGGSMFRSVSS